MKHGMRIVAAAAMAVAVFVLGGIGLFRGASGEGDLPIAPTAQGLITAPGAGATGSLAQGISVLQERLRRVPDDWRSFASLGLAYVQEARITADPSYYPKAEGVLARSLALSDGDNFDATVGMAALDLARHDFAAALAWGQEAVELNPFNGSAYAVLGDAQIELGRYREAFDTFDTMINTQPSLAAYARVSYARELQGDVPGAIRAMQAALRASGTPEDSAWASFQLGELFFNSGRVREAADAYRRGTELAPGYVPPHAGLAKVAWARGDLQRAIRGYTWVTERYPSPEYVIALGDLYAAAGEPQLAAQQYELVRAEEQLFRANGVNVDLEVALFDADHGRPEDALATARAEWARRHSIHVADALAWALHANGDDAAAARYSDRVLRLGTRNALFLFHAGMIQLKLGHEDAAREFLGQAVDVNPHFSIQYAPVAQRALARVETGS